MCVCVCAILCGVNQYLIIIILCQLHGLELGAPLGNVIEGGSDTEIKYVTIKFLDPALKVYTTLRSRSWPMKCS